jgi:hypothetical protein
MLHQVRRLASVAPVDQPLRREGLWSPVRKWENG